MSDDVVRVPDVIGEVLAWRAWQVAGGEKLPFLQSVSHASTMWHPNHWTHATCGPTSYECRRSNDGRVPGEDCTCGLYAARDRAHLVRMGYNVGGPKPVFIGLVGLAGKVIPGDQGWRAEKGRIVRLYVPFRHFKYAEALKELYRVDVVLDNTHRATQVLTDEEGGV